jgi:hypothetical protein
MPPLGPDRCRRFALKFGLPRRGDKIDGENLRWMMSSMWLSEEIRICIASLMTGVSRNMEMGSRSRSGRRTLGPKTRARFERPIRFVLSWSATRLSSEQIFCKMIILYSGN